MSNEIIVINKTRYRYEDARRLGLLADGKAVTAKSVERPARTTQAAEGLITTGTANVDKSTGSEGDKSTEDKSTDGKPKKSASTDDWTAYALANGKTEEELDGLKRDEIAALFTTDE